MSALAILGFEVACDRGWSVFEEHMQQVCHVIFDRTSSHTNYTVIYAQCIVHSDNNSIIVDDLPISLKKILRPVLL